MTSATDSLPLNGTLAPVDQSELIAAVREAYAASTPLYPIGGGTSLDFGVTPKRQGKGLSLGGLTRVVDYPARDMTITVEAGLTMSQLEATLAGERQRLPIDVPDPDAATIGGVVATNFSGPRRYGCGTVRDYVIGITAVDGRGTPFHGGGRVVKNVAGYDFCKLLTGSLGTLGVIAQLTLKLKPRPERSVLMACPARDAVRADELLTALVTSRTSPAAIELLSGPDWRDDPALGPLSNEHMGWLVVGLEGTAVEVDWQLSQLHEEWRSQGVHDAVTLGDASSDDLWRRLAQYPANRDAALVLKVSVQPSRLMSFIAAARAIDPECSLQTHAGSGVLIVRFAKFAAADTGKVLVGQLQPAAMAAGGHAIVLSWGGDGDLVRQDVWGSLDAAARVMSSVKRQFDPRDILNPGRFVY